MKRSALLTLAIAGVVFALVAPASRAASAPHFVLVGDSTVTEQSGWGLGFRDLAVPDVRVTNLARGGRSSKSYRDEGHWDAALAAKGDVYLIQFGHNDQPGKGPERETDPETTFAANLVRYVDEVRGIGARPVLVTSLTRRHFSTTDPGRIASTLTPYAEATKRVARERGVPVIDLHALSIALCERLGPEETAKLNPSGADGSVDRTHLGPEGSRVFARLVVDALSGQLPDLATGFRHELPPAGKARQQGVLYRDVEYGKVGNDPLLLDVAIPEGVGPFPVAVYVHGGGWTGGDKANPADGPALDLLSRAGFVSFSINYRLAPVHRWPACLEDVVTAVRWAKANAHRYEGDPARIVLVGYSAGGHLASFASTLVDERARVQAVVAFAPLTDFVQELPKRGNVLGRAQQGLLNRPEELTRESLGLLAAISPINHLRPGLPPFLLVHGDSDHSVPFEQSVAFRARLMEQGVRCDLIALPGAPHRLTDWERFSPDYSDRAIAWLREIFF